MYLQHYGFRNKPFRLTHDPAYYYGEIHQVPLNELCYSIEERHGLAVLLGEPGAGKTTLLLRPVEKLQQTPARRLPFRRGRGRGLPAPGRWREHS